MPFGGNGLPGEPQCRGSTPCTDTQLMNRLSVAVKRFASHRHGLESGFKKLPECDIAGLMGCETGDEFTVNHATTMNKCHASMLD